MGRIGRALVGAAALAVAIGVPGLGTLAVGALSIGVGGALAGIGISLLAGSLLSTSLSTRRQASETTLQLGEGPRQAWFGRAAGAGSLLDGFNYGGKYGTDWEVLLIALADHECESLEGFYVNDTYHAFTGNGVVTGFSGQLEVYWLPGTASQAWPAIVTANGPGWTANDNCAGICCVAVAYKADKSDAEKPVWSGRPRFLWVMKGKRCYLPRKDSTVPGGSGPHRWADPATWEWTDNAAECRYQFQRGIYALDRVDQPEHLLLGRGLSATEAPPGRAIAHANVCDEAVPLKAGGSERRYCFNGLIGADEDFLTAEGYFADAMGGVILQPEGAIEVEPGQAKAVAAEITDMDLLNLAEVRVEHFRGQADAEWRNTVIPRYVEPGQKWSMIAAPIRRLFADLVADKGQRVLQKDLKHVTSGPQAQRLGEILRRLGRLPATASIPLGPRFAFLEEGDWIGWTSDRHFGGARRVFRIESYSRDEGWKMKLDLRQIAASVYGWNPAVDELTPGAASNQNPPPTDNEGPGSDTWTLTGGQVSGAAGEQPALFIEGAVDQDYVQAIRFEFREEGGDGWYDTGNHAPNTTRKVITGVADGGAYEVAVSYVVDGATGERLILGPVTAGDLTSTASSVGSYDTAALNTLRDRVAMLESEATFEP